MAEHPRLRIAVLSPLAPRRAYATTGAPPLRAFEADVRGIDELLTQIPVGVKLEIADPFGPSGAKLRVELAFTGPKSFRPDGIVAQVSALRGLAEVPARLRELAGRKATRGEIVRELAQLLPIGAWAEALAPTTAAGPPVEGTAELAGAAPAAASPLSSSIDDILANTEQAAPAPARTSAFSSLISQVARGGAAGPTGSTGAASDRAVRAFGAILSDILDHPEVRRLERVWRGARYLLAETSPSSARIDVELIPIDDQNLGDALGYLVDRPAEIHPPPDILVLDTELPLLPSSLAALEIPALVAERLRAPLIVGVRLDDAFDSDEATQALAAIAQESFASWVVLAANGGLVRGPYTSEKLRVPYAQDTAAAGARVFAGAPWLLATLAARAFKHGGWPSPVTGPEAGVLSGFDVHGVVSGGATSVFATERLMTTEGAQRQARRGICALTSIPNRDNVICISAPTLAAAAGPAPTFADQLFAARLSGAVARLGAALSPGVDPAVAEPAVLRALADLFPRHGGTVPYLEAKVHADKLEVIVTPRRFAGTTVGELTLDAPLGE